MNNHLNKLFKKLFFKSLIERPLKEFYKRPYNKTLKEYYLSGSNIKTFLKIFLKKFI